MRSFLYHQRGGAIEAAWFELGKEFVRQGHQVTHVSRKEKGLKNSEGINGVNHIRVRGANAVKNPYILKLLELPYVIRARKVMQAGDIMVSHAFWAPILFPKRKFGKQYVHVGRYPKGQLRLYRNAYLSGAINYFKNLQPADSSTGNENKKFTIPFNLESYQY